MYRGCPSEEDYGCPCDSGRNFYICCKTDDCKARKNWKNVKSSTTTTASSLTLVNGVQMGEALLPIQMISVDDDNKVRVMFDNCSQSSFILVDTARKLGLQGILVNYILICTDGSRKKMQGGLYKLSLKDISGQDHEIEAIGIEKLSSSYSGLKVTNIRKSVQHLSICNSVTDGKLARDQGDLDLLIGTDLAQLHPKAVADVDQLTLMRSKFGTGWTLMGHHKEIIQLTSK